MKSALVHALWVGAGGFVGAILRYAVQLVLHRQLHVFPFGTLAVNLIGCALIGWIVGLAETRQLIGPELRSFAVMGLLGGFTTYSTFGYETFTLMRDGAYLVASASVAAHVVLGLAAVALGYAIAAPR